MEHPIWCIQWPTHWPKPPSPMSFTALQAIEHCPLNWSLTHARYPRIWERAGYPDRVYFATVAGRVIHATLEVITKALANAGCDGMSDPRSTQVLKQLGGISEVVRQVSDQACAELDRNPRVSAAAESVRSELMKHLPSLRQRTQVLLSHLRSSGAPSRTVGIAVRTAPVRLGRNASSLGFGSHAELELHHPTLDWLGKPDWLRITPTECQIIDFKTGVAKPEHHLQLQVYALLWLGDAVLNPRRRLATQLTLIYSDSRLQVPTPGLPELTKLEEELKTRSTDARAAVHTVPPPPRPSREACESCAVRQLCPEYWRPTVQRALFEAPLPMFGDAQVRIRAKIAAWSWKCVISSAAVLTEGTPVLLRARPHDTSITPRLDSVREVRLLGVQILPPSEESGSLPVVCLLRGTEVFVVP